MEEFVNFEIDGIKAQAKNGSTILEAAREVGIDIPTLCFLKDIKFVASRNAAFLFFSCAICIFNITAHLTYNTINYKE